MAQLKVVVGDTVDLNWVNRENYSDLWLEKKVLWCKFYLNCRKQSVEKHKRNIIRHNR